MTTRNVFGLAALAAVLAAVAQPVFAQQTIYTWDVLGGGSQNWQNAANWSPNTAFPNAATNDANLGVGLTSNLSVDVGGSNVIVGNLTLGGTATAVTTDITGASYFILGQSTQAANVQLTSSGVTGSVNKISAPVLIGKNTDITGTSTQSFTFAGDVGQTGVAGTIANLMTNGQTLTIGSGPGSTIQLFEPLVPGNARTLTINNANNSAGTLAQTTVINAVWNRGTGSGQMTFASSQNPAASYLLLQPQTSDATVNLGRAKFVVSANDALGLGTAITANGNSQNWGGQIASDNDARTLAGTIRISNAWTFQGDNSLTVTGTFFQSNNRVIGNSIAAGKSLNLNGTIAPSNSTDAGRVMTFDGPGTTILNGQIVNSTAASPPAGSIRLRGTGRLDVNNGTNTISGSFFAEGGTIAFGANGAWGDNAGTGATAPIVASSGAGITYTPGTADAAGFAAFATAVASTSTGFLALPAADSAASLDFSSGLSSMAGMSVAGDGDLAYTGAVTPGGSGYRWGGRSTTLTLGSNAGTGANPVTYTNGGTVAVTGSPDYTGATSVSGVSLSTAQTRIATNGSSTSLVTTPFPTTLEVTSLGNAGSASSLGASSGDAANLVLNMGTLKVNASTATSTDRLFTVGASGATLESAGAGLVTIGSGGGANVGPSAAATLTLTGTGNGTLGSVLANGVGALSLAKTGTGTWSLDATSTYTGATTVSAGTLIVNGALGSGAVTVASGAELSMGAGSTLLFSTVGPTVTSAGNMTFASGFGVANLVGLDVTVPAGTYTLVTGTVDTSNLSNVGSSNAYTYAPDHTAYFLPGSLNLVVVPEPTGLAALAAGTALLGWRLRRRTTA